MLIKDEKPKTRTTVIGIILLSIAIIAALSIHSKGNSLLEFVTNKVVVVISVVGCLLYFGLLGHSVLTGALAATRKRARQNR